MNPPMKNPNILQRLALNEDLNFLLTNRVPRAALTRFMGWFSRIRHPWVRDASMAVWRTFTDLDLSEARRSSFASLHDCFVRELKPDQATLVPDGDGQITSDHGFDLARDGARLRPLVAELKALGDAVMELLRKRDVSPE